MMRYKNLYIWIGRLTDPDEWCFTITTKEAEELHVSEEYPTMREATLKARQWIDENPDAQRKGAALP